MGHGVTVDITSFNSTVTQDWCKRDMEWKGNGTDFTQ